MSVSMKYWFHRSPTVAIFNTEQYVVFFREGTIHPFDMDACLAQEGSKGSPWHFAGGMGGGLSSGLKQSSYSYFL